MRRSAAQRPDRPTDRRVMRLAAGPVPANAGQVGLLRKTCAEADSAWEPKLAMKRKYAPGATLEAEAFRGFAPESDRIRKVQLRALNCSSEQFP